MRAAQACRVGHTQAAPVPGSGSGASNPGSTCKQRYGHQAWRREGGPQSARGGHARCRRIRGHHLNDSLQQRRACKPVKSEQRWASHHEPPTALLTNTTTWSEGSRSIAVGSSPAGCGAPSRASAACASAAELNWRYATPVLRPLAGSLQVLGGRGGEAGCEASHGRVPAPAHAAAAPRLPGASSESARLHAGAQAEPAQPRPHEGQTLTAGT